MLKVKPLSGISNLRPFYSCFSGYISLSFAGVYYSFIAGVYYSFIAGIYYSFIAGIYYSFIAVLFNFCGLFSYYSFI